MSLHCPKLHPKLQIFAIPVPNITVSEAIQNGGSSTTLKYSVTVSQCWALVPLLTQPRHWRKLKGGARRSGAKEKNGTVAVAQK